VIFLGFSLFIGLPRKFFCRCPYKLCSTGELFSTAKHNFIVPLLQVSYRIMGKHQRNISEILRLSSKVSSRILKANLSWSTTLAKFCQLIAILSVILAQPDKIET